MSSISVALEKCLARIVFDNYKGYDPYDGASSDFRLIRENKLAGLFSTYLNKFSPVNFRRFLRIQPSRQNQALGFIGRAMLVRPNDYHKEIEAIAQILTNESLLKTYGHHCWDSHGFPIRMRGGYRPVGMTDIIGNEAIGRFFLELYQKDPNPSYRDICTSVRDFICLNLPAEHKGYHFFKYKHITPNHQWCYNASAIAASYVEKVSHIFGEPETVSFDSTFIYRSLADIVSRQKNNGAWFYSYNLQTGYEKAQVDFHQGFVLDAILEYMHLNGFTEPFLASYKKGLEFYHKKQFLPSGLGIYRYPRKWPVNIHNQAQGIITFTRAAEAGFGEDYYRFAKTIAEWTIKHMQDKDGHFYFLKYPLFTNKIPYLRWSDAAMAYALAVLLEYEEGR